VENLSLHHNFSLDLWFWAEQASDFIHINKGDSVIVNLTAETGYVKLAYMEANVISHTKAIILRLWTRLALSVAWFVDTRHS